MVKGSDLRDGELGRAQEMVYVLQLRRVDCGEDGFARHLAEALVEKPTRHLEVSGDVVYVDALAYVVADEVLGPEHQ